MNFCPPNAAGTGIRARWQRAQSLVFSTFIAGCLCAALSCNTGPSGTAPGSAVSSVLTLPPIERVTVQSSPAIALSPDGTQIVSLGHANGRAQLYLRSIDQAESTPIPGTEGSMNPIFSPDGQWVGFFADGMLKKVSIQDGTVVDLHEAPQPRGASWGSDDTIVFTPSLNSGVLQIPGSGGAPKVLTTLNDDRSHRWPQLLPGGREVLFTNPTGGNWDDARIVVQQIETGERKVLVEGGTFGRYVPTGHLVYMREWDLMAAPFDLEQLQVTGDPVPIVEGIMERSRTGSAQFSFSRSGTLVYIPGDEGVLNRSLVWVNRDGSERPLLVSQRPYDFPRLSPDGQRLSVMIVGATENVFLYDIGRETLTEMVSEGSDGFAIWTRDGKRLTFRSSKTGAWNLYWKPMDGPGAEEQLTTGRFIHEATSWSHDGKVLAFTEFHPETNRDIWVLPFEGARQPRPMVQTAFDEGGATFSADGRWFAYSSNESGRSEIYAQPYPGPGGPTSADSGPQGGKRQVSTEGGTEPLWAPSGRELFYRHRDQMMVVEVKTQPDFAAGTPRPLFEGRYESGGIDFRPNYDVTSDGQQFVMVKGSEQLEGPTQLSVVPNWFEELNRRVPAGGH